MMLSGEFATHQMRIIPLLVLILPLVIDGTHQMITGKESNNRRRFYSGLMFGFALNTIVFSTYNIVGTGASPSNMFPSRPSPSGESLR